MVKEDDDVELMIDDVMNRESKLSDWEAKFIDSINEQYSETLFLTDRQREKLEAIWERVTE